MKRLLCVVLCILLAVAIVGCGAPEAEPSESAEDQENKVYDNDFIADLVKGCEARWDYANSEEAAEGDEPTYLKNGINIELEAISKYANLPFEDNVLKEKALAYINELNNGIDVLSTYGADAFYDNWSAHYDHRTQLLVEIDELYPLTFDEEYQTIFNELTSNGSQVIENNEKEDAANSLLSQFEFVEAENESSYSGFRTFEATVENATDFDFENYGVNIDILNAEGIVIDTQYCSVDNWTSGKKVKVEFAVFDDEFASYEVKLDYYA